MNLATKAALTALSGIKVGGGYACKGTGLGIGYIGKGIRWTGEKIERGGFAVADFGSEMIDSGVLAWKIANEKLTQEQLQAIVNGETPEKPIEAEVVDDTKATGLANLKEAATKAAETAMEAVAQAIKKVEATEQKAPEQKQEQDMTPAEMAEAFC